MFTGIIEATGEVAAIEHEGSNIHIDLVAPFLHELKIDQSVAHNGVCLTVVNISEKHYRVTAIQETLDRTNLSAWKPGTIVNLERCMRLGDRLDGHIVQGHVDTTARCTSVIETNGSWLFSFDLDMANPGMIVEKGSICVNGVSLTVVNAGDQKFSVAIIPYTFEHTNFSQLQEGDPVNIEFDIIGKYVARMLSSR
ncbi:MAG: hypothetical protein RL220_77 [Bacteroidota bacterium]|jgi:riboflavin synthase